MLLFLNSVEYSVSVEILSSNSPVISIEQAAPEPVLNEAKIKKAKKQEIKARKLAAKQAAKGVVNE